MTTVSFDNPYASLPHFDAKDIPGCVGRLLEQMVGRADANETAIFARQLEYIYTQTYDILRPELKARQLLPVDTRVPSGADSFTYSQFDKIGNAAIVHNYAQDFPNADVVAKQFKQGIVSLGISYQYTYQDMRAAAMAGIPLEAKKAEAARYAMELKLEQLSVAGDTSTGLVGILNAPSIGTVTKVSQNNSGATTSTWAQLITDALAKGNLTAAAQEILKDTNAMQRAIWDNSLGVHQPDTLVLPTDCYSILASTQLAPNFASNTSMLKFILDSSPWLKSIEHWAQLDTHADLQGGTAGHGIVLAYKKDPALVSLIISQEFEQFAPQLRGMSMVIPCHMRTGAVEVRYPKSVAVMVGCD